MPGILIMFRTFICALPLLTLPGLAASHEFWIEPLAWQVEPDTTIAAHIRVGENMKGAPLSYFPDKTRQFAVATPKGIYKAGGTIGDRPVLKGAALDHGLYTVIYVSGDDLLTYNDPAKFENFVRHKDLGNTLEDHVARGLPETGFTEKYSRYAKSLIGVGHSKGTDKVFGLLTEITALRNPYVDDMSEGMPIYVSYRKGPRQNEQVEIYERNSEGEISVSLVRTDDEGIAIVPVKPGHDYMLDAVVMRPITPSKEGDPVWESLWANLTFHVPAE